MTQLVFSVRRSLAGLPVSVGIAYLISTILNLVAYNQGDLSHTVGSSYAYLFGHVLDFYDYNTTEFIGNDYFPTTYLVFAAWMAPVKLLVSPGVQNGIDISTPEVVWAKILLLLLFWLTFIVVSKIARELFPARPTTQTTVRIAFLLSPLAAFAFNVIGQYDIIGVLFTSIGFLYYLRGDKWRFALFFALAASNKYFALVIFLPLVLLQFKKIRDIVLLGLVGISVTLVEGAVYLSNVAFREHTIFGLLGGKLQTSQESRGIQILIAIIFIVGCLALWRLVTPSSQTLAPLAVFTVVTAFGFMLTVLAWHPHWLIVITPFFALATGYLRRPTRFLVFESAAFVAFVWVVVNMFAWNVDATTVERGALGNLLVEPSLMLGTIYPVSVVLVLRLFLIVYLFSPVLFALVEWRQAGRSLPTADGPNIRSGVWWLRVLAIPLAWTVPIAALLLASA